MRISEIARRFKINTQPIYFYERIGLLPEAKRNPVGYRIFEDSDIERLNLIERAKALGLTLDEIKQILQLKDGQCLTCEAVHQRLLQKLQDIEHKIAQLQELRGELLPLIERCEQKLSHAQELTDCGVFNDESGDGNIDI